MSKPARMTDNTDLISGLEQSQRLHARAKDVMPDGVAAYSQNRAPHPLYLAGAQGARLFDVDGNEYIDYMLGAGPLVLGHRHPAIVAAVQQALDEGVPNIGVCERQIELAELLKRHLPSMDQVRFVPTGTEAVQSVIKIARRFTRRNMIAKFEGAYHGQAENVMVSVTAAADKRGDVNAPNAVPYHCHLPEELLNLTLVLPFNDIDACTALIERHADDLAVVLIEPMLGFAGAIPAEPEFLAALRDVTARHGVLLAFDEVITGFRLAMGGGQELYGIAPDLTVLGKAIGGGMPLSFQCVSDESRGRCGDAPDDGGNERHNAYEYDG
jgi:glutamate-1-semialdehyde 2,1-aminomutase